MNRISFEQLASFIHAKIARTKHQKGKITVVDDPPPNARFAGRSSDSCGHKWRQNIGFRGRLAFKSKRFKEMRRNTHVAHKCSTFGNACHFVVRELPTKATVDSKQNPK